MDTQARADGLHSETLYAAFASRPGGNGKNLLYQWSLPEGVARHVSELVSSTCMMASCVRHFGLLGESCLPPLAILGMSLMVQSREDIVEVVEVHSAGKPWPHPHTSLVVLLMLLRTHAVHVENFQSRYCEMCRAQLSRGAHLGLLSQRRDSVISASSRRGSLAVSNPSTSRPGSRRGSILVPGHHGPLAKPPLGPSGLSSRPGSRRPSSSSPTPPVLH